MLRLNQATTDGFNTSDLDESLSGSIRHTSPGGSDIRRFERGTILFIEGDRPRGVFVLREGRVKLTASTPEGRVLILGVAGPHDTLGLSAVISRAEYEVTAEAIEGVAARFIRSDIYLAKLRLDTLMAAEAAAELSRRYREAHAMMRSLANSDPVLVRLARLFLKWTRDRGTEGLAHIAAHSPLRIQNSFTHQQIAEMIGSSRETVTRVLKEMRERDLVTLKGSDLCIHSPAKLTLLASGGLDQFCDARHEARLR